VVCLVVVTVWINLPLLSGAYKDCAVADRAQGQLASARRALERAIKLDPRNAVAHYNLANVYEDLFSDESAIREYQIAAMDSGTPRAVVKQHPISHTSSSRGIRRLVIRTPCCGGTPFRVSNGIPSG
jgi:hypothetical protein